MNPRVTVLTTVYNGLPYLKEAIESILNQTYTDFEFLIIDDTSTDDSLKCILSYKDPRIKVIINENNIGQTASLNKGLKIAKGELIARLDQDDVNLPNRLEEQVSYLDKHSDLSIICSWMHMIDSNEKIIRDLKKTLPNYGDFLGKILLGLCPIWHPSVLFRKDAILGLGSYDTSYAPAEDYELWNRIAVNRLNAAIVPQFLMLHRVHNQSQSHIQASRQLDSTRRAHIEIIRNFVSNEHVNCLAALLRLDEGHCAGKYTRKHIYDIGQTLNEMITNVREKQNLSAKESKSLRKKIYGRVGIGMNYTNLLTSLPAPLFYPLFFTLSPLLLPNIRPFLSTLYSYSHKLRHIFKS